MGPLPGILHQVIQQEEALQQGQGKTHGFESGANARKAWMKLDANLRSLLEVLEQATKADNDHTKYMSEPNRKMVNICHQQEEYRLYQHKQIANLTKKIESLTKLVYHMGGKTKEPTKTVEEKEEPEFDKFGRHRWPLCLFYRK